MLKCNQRGHGKKECIDIVIRLVLFQAINWKYQQYLKKSLNTFKITVGADNTRLVNWGFAHFRSEKERDSAIPGLREMHTKGEILEPVTFYNRGPPQCCHFCGEIENSAGIIGHKATNCPKRGHWVEDTGQNTVQLPGTKYTYSEAVRKRNTIQNKTSNQNNPYEGKDSKEPLHKRSSNGKNK